MIPDVQTAYLQFIVILHAAFALVFLFLDRESPSRFARLFAVSWAIEGLRATILMPQVHTLGSSTEPWFAAAEVLCYPANWCLLAGCAALVGVRLPRWLGPAYFLTGIPLVLLGRFGLPSALVGWTGQTLEEARFSGVLVNLTILFVPVALARFALMVWLFRLWRTSRLSGALMATVFCVPYAVVAIAVPFQFYYSYTPEWISLLWFVRVLGFSMGLVMLLLSLQRVAVAKSEANLAAAQALTNIGSWEWDAQTGVASWSAEMYRLYGRDPAAGVMTYAELLAAIHPEDRERFCQGEVQALAEKRDNDHEFRVLRPDGTCRWIQGRNVRVFDAQGGLTRLLGAEQDVTDRKRAASRAELQLAVTRVLSEGWPQETALRQILERLARELEADAAECWEVQRPQKKLHCVLRWSRSETPALPDEKTSARPESAQVAERTVVQRTLVWSDAAASADPPRDHRGAVGFPLLLRADTYGAMVFLTANPTPPDAELSKLLAALGTQIGQFIDRQHLEEQYRQAQKMEAIGTLAGGMAHDFNNVLNGIAGYCELASLELADPAVVQAHLDEAQAATQRAAELVRRIMTFSRQSEQKRVPLDLGTTVTEAMKLLRATIPAGIEITTDCAGGLPRILADATSIHQIVVNLGTNASHAMQGKVGRLTVAVDVAVIDGDLPAGAPNLKPGRYVRLRMTDTGCGMEEAMLARIFEPFFTTKLPGEGTGLGLAMVHGLVQTHEGAISVRSQPGVGTVFEVFFPALAANATEEKVAGILDTPRGQGERILFVDDERSLGEMGRRMLQRLGYIVEVHDSPVEALRAFRLRPERFELAVVDLSMPSMSGLQLAEEITHLRPDLPVVLTTGYTGELTASRLQASGVQELLMKPYSVVSLGRAVHCALTGAVTGMTL